MIMQLSYMPGRHTGMSSRINQPIDQQDTLVRRWLKHFIVKKKNTVRILLYAQFPTLNITLHWINYITVLKIKLTKYVYIHSESDSLILMDCKNSFLVKLKTKHHLSEELEPQMFQETTFS